jgi:hypothetical protein
MGAESSKPEVYSVRDIAVEEGKHCYSALLNTIRQYRDEGKISINDMRIKLNNRMGSLHTDLEVMEMLARVIAVRACKRKHELAGSS